MIGREILELRIERLLAEGGMGAVYLARHVRLPSMFKVIKVLLPEHAASEVLRRRFHREAEAVARLAHACILGIENFGALDDGQLFIVMPFLDGQPLDAYLRERGRLPARCALHLAVQLCDALDHAHARGIIHRDLKPANVYVVPTSANPYALKLLDFGIAKLACGDPPDIRTRSGVMIGTPAYMAVEQYEHADAVTHLADVYSLAVLVWELVTGRLPWQHADPVVLYYLQRTAVPERPPADVMPPAWTDLLLAALSADPTIRPQSARELAVSLASSLPAAGRAPRGAEILTGLAPHFMRSTAPGDETVPSVPGRVMAVQPRPSRGSPPALSTTLSAASGVARPPAAWRVSRWRLALAATGTAALAALATAGIASRALLGSSPRATAPAAAPTSPAAAPITPAAAPAPTPTPSSPPLAVAPAALAPTPPSPPLAVAPAAPVPKPPSSPSAARSPTTARSPTAAKSLPATGGARVERHLPAVDPDDVSGPAE